MKPNAAPVAQPVVPPTTLARSTKPRKGSSIVYVIPGLTATVKIPRAAFVGDPPEALIIRGNPFAPPIIKLSKEERVALRKAMTPAQRAARAREIADRAIRRAAKLEAAAR